MDYLDIDTTPYSEDCAQVGRPDYMPRARAEAKAFIAQIYREIPTPDDDKSTAYLTVKSHPHDFGSYLQVRIRFDPENERDVEWAYAVEGHSIEHWDDQAKADLAAAGFPVGVEA